MHWLSQESYLGGHTGWRPFDMLYQLLQHIFIKCYNIMELVFNTSQNAINACFII